MMPLQLIQIMVTQKILLLTNIIFNRSKDSVVKILDLVRAELRNSLLLYVNNPYF
jgi:hypothetical protein